MIRRLYVSLMLAFSFGTLMPLPDLGDLDESHLRLSVGFLPVAGAVLGLILWSVVRFSRLIFPTSVAALIGLGLYTLLTGGLHVDGWMDTWDAIGSRKPPDQALAIMKDSRVGAMGVMAAIILLLGKYTAISHIPRPWALWVAVPVLARATAVWSMALSPAARNEGLGALYAERVPRLALVLASLWALILLVFVTLTSSLVSMAALFVLALLMATAGTAWIRRRFGGSTGDTYGALIEATELIGFLIVTGRWIHG